MKFFKKNLLRECLYPFEPNVVADEECAFERMVQLINTDHLSTKFVFKLSNNDHLIREIKNLAERHSALWSSP